MKYVQPIRKSLGFRTVFNILGPLANPADVPALVLGVAEEGLMEMMAEALQMLGARYAMVVHSNGLDEISIATTTKILELKDGQIIKKDLNPKNIGMKLADLEGLTVTDAKSSASILKDVLSGKENGPCKDIVILNSAAAIIAAGMADDFASAIKIAETSVSEGKASACLEKLIEISNKV